MHKLQYSSNKFRDKLKTADDFVTEKNLVGKAKKEEKLSKDIL